MSSKLIITPVEKLQSEINKIVRAMKNTPGVYISLNKTQKSVETLLNKNKINTSKLFFIDCVTHDKTNKDTLHISPNELDNLNFAINDFIKEIPGKKYIIIDALSTLLIYNPEKNVAAFIKELTEISAKKDVEIFAVSPTTKGEELLNKIFNFFDEVKRGKDEKTKKQKGDEELIY